MQPHNILLGVQCISFFLQGYRYAATQYSSYCFCDNDYGAYGYYAATCDTTCVGDSSQICGGGMLNSVMNLYPPDGTYYAYIIVITVETLNKIQNNV